MKKLVLALSILATFQNVSFAEVVAKSCSDSVYAILHQSCSLNYEEQKHLLSAQSCATEDEYVYYFNFPSEVIKYDIRSCSFN